MDETLISDAESYEDIKPVEIKFGDVIQLYHEKGAEPSRPMVVTDPADEGYIYAAGIISDDEGHPKMGGPGTHIQPAEVIGYWPLDKMEAAWRNFFGEGAQVMIDDLIQKSQKPPIMFKGKYS